MNPNFTEQIATLLADEGVGTLGETLWVGNAPDDKNEVVMMVAQSGLDPDPDMEIRRIDIDFWGRNPNSAQGYSKMQDVWNRLHRRKAYQLTDFYVFMTRAIGTIDDMGKDANQRQLHKLRIRFTFRVLVAVS